MGPAICFSDLQDTPTFERRVRHSGRTQRSVPQVFCSFIFFPFATPLIDLEQLHLMLQSPRVAALSSRMGSASEAQASCPD